MPVKERRLPSKSEAHQGADARALARLDPSTWSIVAPAGVSSTHSQAGSDRASAGYLQRAGQSACNTFCR